MEAIAHLTRKLLEERARSTTPQQQPTPPETAPPPYTESEDSESDEPDDESETPPVKLTINAAHSIHGSNNLIPTSPTPLADATRFSTLLLHAVNQINNANSTVNASGCRRPLRVDLTINCGITVVGDRNVVGNVGLRPRVPNATSAAGASVAAAAAVAGAKRKAEEVSDEDDERVVKKVTMSGAQD